MFILLSMTAVVKTWRKEAAEGFSRYLSYLVPSAIRTRDAECLDSTVYWHNGGAVWTRRLSFGNYVRMQEWHSARWQGQHYGDSRDLVC